MSRIRINAIAHSRENGVPMVSCAVITSGQPSRAEAVILNSRPNAFYAATMARALRAGSYVVSCFHIAKSTCDSFLASAVMAMGAPRRSAMRFAVGIALLRACHLLTVCNRQRLSAIAE